ncbi:MAG: sporulation protein YtxC, partial [Bacillota bacterium]
DQISANGAAAAPPAFAASEASGQGASGAGALGGTVLTTNLLRWKARLSRQFVEALAARPQGTVIESVVWFHSPSYMGALKRAAAAAVSELVAEREEQRSTSPWRGLWMGPPPRIYEVHLFRAPSGAYHLLDRWGMPAGRRWLGEGLGEAGSEEVAVGHLVRLSPRRIIVHLADEAPIQAGLRAAFPGRVYTCRGCPRCSLSGRTPAPSPSR